MKTRCEKHEGIALGEAVVDLCGDCQHIIQKARHDLATREVQAPPVRMTRIMPPVWEPTSGESFEDFKKRWGGPRWPRDLAPKKEK